MNTCETCKHWRADEQPGYDNVHGVGRCAATIFWWDASEWDEDGGDRILKPEHKDCTAFANDGSGYSAKLYTRSTHGCTMWESKAA